MTAATRAVAPSGAEAEAGGYARHRQSIASQGAAEVHADRDIVSGEPVECKPLSVLRSADSPHSA